MILCRCVDSLISPPPLSPRKSPQYLHFVFKPFFCSRSTYPICCVYLWVSPQLSIYGRAVHQYFSLVSCCCQIGRVCFSSPKYRDCKKLIPEAQITILSRAHSVSSLRHLCSAHSYGRMYPFQNPTRPTSGNISNPCQASFKLDASRVKHKQPPTWRDRNPSNAVQPRKRIVSQSLPRIDTAFQDPAQSSRFADMEGSTSSCRPWKCAIVTRLGPLLVEIGRLGDVPCKLL